MTFHIDDEARAGFKRGLVSTIYADRELTREQLLGRLLGFLEDCLNDLIEAGEIHVAPAPERESHMDVFATAARH
jgi:hypothetical protein